MGYSSDDTIRILRLLEGADKVPIYGWSMDGLWMDTVTVILRKRGQARCPSMNGPWMDPVTVASTDT